jgi:hypothetical protein
MIFTLKPPFIQDFPQCLNAEAIIVGLYPWCSNGISSPYTIYRWFPHSEPSTTIVSDYQSCHLTSQPWPSKKWCFTPRTMCKDSFFTTTKSYKSNHGPWLCLVQLGHHFSTGGALKKVHSPGTHLVGALGPVFSFINFCADFAWDEAGDCWGSRVRGCAYMSKEGLLWDNSWYSWLYLVGMGL